MESGSNDVDGTAPAQVVAGVEMGLTGVEAAVGLGPVVDPGVLVAAGGVAEGAPTDGWLPVQPAMASTMTTSARLAVIGSISTPLWCGYRDGNAPNGVPLRNLVTIVFQGTMDWRKRTMITVSPPSSIPVSPTGLNGGRRCSDWQEGSWPSGRRACSR